MLDKGEKKNIYVHKHTPITSPLLSSTFSSPTLFPSSFSPRFRSPFPSYHPPDVQSSFLLSSSPLSFPPCFRHFYLHLLPLSPFSILLRCFSFFLSSLFPSSFSPPFSLPFSLLSLIILQCSILFPSIILTSLFPPMLPSLLSPSSASFPPSPSSSVASLSFSPPSPLVLIILRLLYFYYPLLPWKFFSSVRLLSFTLFCPLFYSLPTFVLFFPLLSLSLLSPFSYLDPVFSLLLSPPIHCLFPPSLVWSFSLPPLSFDTSPTRKIYLFHFSLSRPQLSPLIHCLHLPSTKNSSPPYPPSPLFLLLISLTQTLKIPSNNKLFPKLSTKFCFPPKTLPTLMLFAPKIVLNAPNILFPLLQLTPNKSQTIHKTDNIQDTQQTHL